MRVRVMVFNTTFNNISVISWWSVLLVEETGVFGKNHRLVLWMMRIKIYVYTFVPQKQKQKQTKITTKKLTRRSPIYYILA
jgi:hypothetical protein